MHIGKEKKVENQYFEYSYQEVRENQQIKPKQGEERKQ